MRLAFTKMEGLGNDFIVIDATRTPLDLDNDQIRRLCDRHFGIGCDQLLLVEPPRSAHTEFYYRIFNSDGSEVEQCGNGARCFARFVTDKGLTTHRIIDVGTAKGDIRLYLEEEPLVRVNMGIPVFSPQSIPLLADVEADHYLISVADQEIEMGALSMGNPHAVLQVDDIHTAPVESWGPLIECHPLFPNRVNAGFMAIVNRSHIRLRVYERGVGETLACGTGACAAVAIGIRWGLLDEQVKVNLPGGDLTICWAGDRQPIWMTGPAKHVFEGVILL